MSQSGRNGQGGGLGQPSVTTAVDAETKARPRASGQLVLTIHFSMDEVVEFADRKDLADLVRWVADEQGSTDFIDRAAGLAEDAEKGGVGERHVGEIYNDRLPWGEVRLDGALKVVEAGDVNLAAQGNDRHGGDIHSQMASHRRPKLAVRSFLRGCAVACTYCPLRALVARRHRVTHSGSYGALGGSD